MLSIKWGRVVGEETSEMGEITSLYGFIQIFFKMEVCEWDALYTRVNLMLF